MPVQSVKPTKEQRAAIQTEERRVAVIAGPGTGKTTVILERIRHLMKKNRVPGREIAVLTFGKRAAGEIRARLLKRGINLPEVCVTTLHSFAYELLKGKVTIGKFKFGERGGPYEAKSLLRKLKDQYPHLQSTDVELFARLISYSRNSGQGISRSIERQYEILAHLEENILRLSAEYSVEKINEGIWDHDDLIFMATNQLKARLKTAKRLKLLHIIVDEYQDVNVAQRKMLAALVHACHSSCSLFVVGDPAQTIFSFNGVDPQWRARFKADWTGSKDFPLTLNQRSTQRILNLAMAIEKPLNLNRVLKSSMKKSGLMPGLKEFPSQKQEAVGVIAKIGHLIASGTKPNQIAVLARHRYDLHAIQKEAAKQGIEVEFNSHDALVEQDHVQDVLAIFRLAKDKGNQEAFLRCMALAPGLGTSNIKGLWRQTRRSHSSRDFWTTILLHIPAGTEGIVALRKGIRTAADENTPLAKRLEEVCKLVRPLLLKKYRRSWIHMLNDFRVLAGLAGNSTLTILMQKLEVQTDSIASSNQVPEKTTFSTMHGAKGREWKIVFLIGLNNGTLPTKLAYSDEQKLEERRVLFVAITRAKRRLYITRFKHGQRLRSISCFLTESAASVALKRVY